MPGGGGQGVSGSRWVGGSRWGWGPRGLSWLGVLRSGCGLGVVVVRLRGCGRQQASRTALSDDRVRCGWWRGCVQVVKCCRWMGRSRGVACKVVCPGQRACFEVEVDLGRTGGRGFFPKRLVVATILVYFAWWIDSIAGYRVWP